MKTVYCFIDAANVRAVVSDGRRIDWAKMVDYLKARHEAADLAVFYYDAYFENGQRPPHRIEQQRHYFTKLEKCYGFKMRTKPLKQIKTEVGFLCPKCHKQSCTCEYCMEKTQYGKAEKGNLDIEIAMDMIHKMPDYDEAILFSGDSDFLEVVNILRKSQKKVFIYSTRGSLSTELRTAGDGCKDIKLIKEDIWDDDFRK
jgi:uncharacterized LabA/DUF88 family protein